MKTTCMAMVAMGLVAGCATAPPVELTEARAEYQRASTSPTASLATEQLGRAHQALALAESSYAERPRAERTRDLAYAAKREAEAVQSAARAATEDQRRATAEAAVAAAQTGAAQQAASAEARAQAESAARAEADRARELAAQEATEAKQRADDEQRARTVEAQPKSQQLTEAERARLVAEQQAAQERQQRLAADAQRQQATVERERAEQRLHEFATIRHEARGKVITLNGSVLFTTGTARLLPSARERLDEVAEALKTEAGAQFLVEGFTDSRGSEPRNLRLSQARADAVRDYLVGQGVDEARIRARGEGADRPVASNATADGRANNRRVEIIVTRRQAER